MITKRVIGRLEYLEAQEPPPTFAIIVFGNGIGVTLEDAVKKYKQEHNIKENEKLNPCFYLNVSTDEEIRQRVINKESLHQKKVNISNLKN